MPGGPNAHDPAVFYRDLLGWEIGHDEGDWLVMRSPQGGAGRSFQSEPDHVPPVRPAEPSTCSFISTSR